jgi:primosomal protein N' (replication factor Y)
MNRFADVALPVAVDKNFTYRIPVELQESARVGVRAVVPFGRKLLTGLIVDLPTDSPLPSLKSLKEIIDPSPIVSEELLRLCQWVAEYYMAPLGEVLKAAVPHGFAAAGKRMVRLIAASPDEEKARRPTARSTIVALLRERGAMATTEIQKSVRFKSLASILNALEREGVVESEEMLPHPAGKPRFQEYICVGSVDPAMLSEAAAGLSPRQKKAGRVLAAITEMRIREIREIPLKEFLQQSGGSSAVVAPFRRSGLLPIVSRETTRQEEYGTEEQTLLITLNESQRAVLRAVTEAMEKGTPATILLHGVTGSGKTQVYVEVLRNVMSRGKTAIVLVPEISLTPQIVRRFKSHFGTSVAVVHSRMSAGERNDVWRSARRGTARIVIGPRSAVFAPLDNIGIIVVDEEHEATYKQFDASPRYHARDVAIVRALRAGAITLLGSATPSVESYHNALTGKYALLQMPQRIDDVPLPPIRIVDMTAERKQAYAALKESLSPENRRVLKDFRQPIVSAPLHAAIEERLARREGVILLQNRRGFAPFVECPDCGFTERCDNCNVTLTYHLPQKHLRCHYCGLVRPVRTTCPDCQGIDLRMHGTGTQRVEEELGRLFPTARILRMDLDTTSRRGAHDKILRSFGDGKADILLGTQMVAKGLDFPRVTLVGVISADTQMLLPDFRSAERTFQLLTQVAGRAGRSTLRGEVIIQTHQPGHYALRHVIDHNYPLFFEEESAARSELGYPPFSRLVLLEARGEKEDHVRKFAEQWAERIRTTDADLAVLGPAPAVISRINKHYRWHILIKNIKERDPSGSRLRRTLQETLLSPSAASAQGVRAFVDVDPVGTL